jgi:hypothetical protein
MPARREGSAKAARKASATGGTKGAKASRAKASAAAGAKAKGYVSPRWTSTGRGYAPGEVIDPADVEALKARGLL